LVELLSGKLSKNVMERVCRKGDGLFPASGEIKMSCSCPDGARMCKHVAATLYGAGARLDAAPDLLFALRGVDQAELIADAGAGLPSTGTSGAGKRILADDDLATLFGVEMAPAPMEPKAKFLKTKPYSGRGSTASKIEADQKTTALTLPAKAKTLVNSVAAVARPEAPKKPSSKSKAAKSAGVQAAVEKIEAAEKKVRAATAMLSRPLETSAVSTGQEEAALQRRVRTKAARWIKRP
jgi:uncharacterized Zn finger protein